MASGVLLLCLGQATRLVEYYQGERKQYYAEIMLGQATDTYDAVGVVTATSLIPTLANETIEHALDRFRGDVLQRPPAFSAIKQGGEPLHQKARRGEAITVAPRCVTFFRIDLLDFHPPDRITLRVLCSAGAYIRSLAHDLGLALGTHACLDVLRRQAAGVFGLHEAYTLDVVEEAAKGGRLGDLLIPPGCGLPMPIVPVEMDAMRRLGFGQIVRLPTNKCDDKGLAQAHHEQGRLAGIMRCLRPADDEQDVWLWKAEKWMN
jgi:tRNA pseudouridine55 synthase